MGELSFSEVQSRIDSIDNVLNEEVMKRQNKEDIKEGFNPSRFYSFSEKLGFNGIDALKKLRREFNYLLLEVSLAGNGSYAKFLLRGFERCSPVHYEVANCFLGDDVNPIFNAEFKWPFIEDRPSKDFKHDFQDYKLMISAIGGGNANFSIDEKLRLSGQSGVFGPITREYQPEFRKLLRKLLQKPAYLGYKVELR